MFSAQLNFPYNLSESEALCLASAFDGLALGHATKRIDQNIASSWLIEWYFDTEPSKMELENRLSIQAKIMETVIDSSALNISKIEDKNWLKEVYEELEPFSVGPFFIYGSNYQGGTPEGQMPILVHAATAFGSGGHGTTKGCLQAMLDLKGKGICPWNVLDMGTGSGILSISVWRLWQTPITAIDICAESVRVAEQYRDLNNIPSDKMGMTCASGDGFKTPVVNRRKPYDLVIANILTGPLMDMAPGLKSICDDLGYVILSGMLKTQADDVQSVYESQGLTLKNRIDIDDWSTLVMQNV